MIILFILFILVASIIGITFYYEVVKYPLIIKQIQKKINDNLIDEAKNLMKKIPIRKRKDSNTIWLNAQINMEKGQYILAMSALQDIIFKNNYTYSLKEIEVRSYLVELYEKTGRRKEAVSLLEHIKFNDSNNEFANIKLGKHYYREKDYDRSEGYLLKAADKGTNDAEVYFILGSMRYMNGNIVSAVKYLNYALKLNPGYSEAKLLLGMIEYESKNYKKAESIFLTLKDLKYYSGIAFAYISLCRYTEGDFDECIKIANIAFMKLSKKEPIYIPLLETVAAAHIDSNKILESKNILEKIISIDKKNEYAYLRIKLYQYVFLYPDKLIPFVTVSDNELFTLCEQMLEYFGYAVKASEIKLNLITIICHSKKTKHDNILFVFSRLSRVLDLHDIETFAKNGIEKHVSLVYIITPYIFSLECLDYNKDRILVECYNGKDLYKVLNHEDFL